MDYRQSFIKKNVSPNTLFSIRDDEAKIEIIDFVIIDKLNKK